jgi:predicted dehydrogenase
MSKVKWGIISTALIGTEKVIPAMQQGKYCEITAISSRDLEAATSTAARLGIPKAYGSYQEMLDDPEIEAVYNPLPNHLHIPWSLKALEAGKHVLCEKPIAITSVEGQKLVDAARAHPELKVMEAFMYRFHPQWGYAREKVQDGALGKLRTIQTFFSYYNDDPNNIRNMADIGGGGMLDIGCYAISTARFIFGAEPHKVTGLVEYDPNFRTDILASAMMVFSEGTATFTVSTQIEDYQRVTIVGTKGWLEIEIPFNAPTDRPCRLWLIVDGEKEEVTFETANQYTLQGEAFSKAVLEGTPVPTPIEDAVANMKVIEAVLKSGESGNWEQV